MSAALAPVIPIRGTLYEILDHLDALYESEALAETAEQQAEIHADIARWINAELSKVDGITRYLAHCKAQQRFAAEEIERLQARKAAFESRADRLKQCVIIAMGALEKERLEGHTSTLTLQRCPPSVDITDETAVPAEYKAATITVSGETWERLRPMLPTVTPRFAVSKTAVKTAITAKLDVPGATLVTDKMTVVCR